MHLHSSKFDIWLAWQRIFPYKLPRKHVHPDFSRSPGCRLSKNVWQQFHPNGTGFRSGLWTMTSSYLPRSRFSIDFCS